MKRKCLIIVAVVFAVFILNSNVNAKSIGLQILDNTQSNLSCTGYFGDVNDENSLMNLLVNSVFTPIRIAVPILLLVFTTLDFSKVVFSDSKDGMDKAKKNFVKRAIIAVVIFFIPSILKIAFDIIDNQAIKACINKF